MDWHIGLTLAVIALTLIAFIREWAAPDVIALTVLCAVVALGLIDPGRMTEVFKNEAPLTIAALFVIGGALERSGANVAVAITGIAGPDGGSEQKPVGTVIFARAERGVPPGDSSCEQRHFPAGSRAGVRLHAALVALELLLP